MQTRTSVKAVARATVQVKQAGVDDAGQPVGYFDATVAVYDNVDYQNDVLEKGAFDASLKSWTASGDPIPVIWSHMWDDPFAHVGFVDPKNVTSEDDGLHVHDAVLDLTNPMGKQVYELMKGRRVREFSFGYDPTDFKMDGDVRHLNSVDLWELGPTLKGANPATVLEGVKGGLAITEQDAPGSTEVDASHDDMEGTETPVLVVPDDDPDASHDDADDETKTAIASHGTATDDGAWDGPAQWAAIDPTPAHLRGACAWVDPEGDPATQAAYKFIHHFITDGAPGAASTRGCTASVAILNGGRGGANIPDADRQGVYNHVRKHLADAGVDPIPELASKSLKVGRVLSGKNEADLRDARDLIDKVLASVTREDQADKDKRARNGSAASREDPKPKSLGQTMYDATLLELGGLDDHAG